MENVGGVRTQRAERTRATIVASARDLFIEQGYRGTSLRDVAARAGISHPGLLRHFSGKDELLGDVVDLFERESEAIILDALESAEPGILPFGDLARRNASMPGYLALFAALTGEASTATHPAHDRMRERYARLIDLSSDVIADAVDHDLVSSDRDARSEAIRLAAAWDGLQVIAQYLPDRVDIAALLDLHVDQLALPVGWRPSADGPPHAGAMPLPAIPIFSTDSAAGYAVGRERRARIVADAMTLFSREGYADTTLREIAERVGVSKSALLHHFPSKEALLLAVVADRDRGIERRPDYIRATRAADELRALSVGASANGRSEAGLIEVYAVLSCEAVPSEHPAHAYFAERYRLTIDHFTELMRLAQVDGDLPSHRDPTVDGLWLTALWDGLQYQWLYDRDAIDVGRHLAAHLEDILPQ